MGLWAEEGPACDAVSTVPPRREGCPVRSGGAATIVADVDVVMQELELTEREVRSSSW